MIARLLFAASAAFAAYAVLQAFAPGGAWRRSREAARWAAGAAAAPSPRAARPSLSDIPALRRALEGLKPAERLSRALEEAQVRLSVAAFLLSAGVAALLAFLFLNPALGPWAAVPAALVSAAVPFWFLRLRRARYLARFSQGFPDALGMISNTIKVGHGIDTAMQAVARSAPRPVSDEFARVERQLKLGVSLPEALESLHSRVRIPELKIFCTGISIHHEMGGNLSELLDNLEQTIRERFALKREIKALSSQGVMSSWVLFFIPIFLAMLWLQRDPQMFLSFLSSNGGRFTLTACAVCQALGFVWIRQIVKLED